MLAGTLYHPLAIEDRIAILDRNAHLTEDQSAWMDSLHESSPQCVAGSPAQMEILAQHKRNKPGFLSSVDHSLLITLRAGSTALSESERDVLWNVFRVPVFELIYNAEGTRLLAYECPARCHWHGGLDLDWKESAGGELSYRAQRGWFRSQWANSGLKGTVIYGLCDCGRAGLRLALDLPAAQPDRTVRRVEADYGSALADLAVQAATAGR